MYWTSMYEFPHSEPTSVVLAKYVTKQSYTRLVVDKSTAISRYKTKKIYEWINARDKEHK